MMRHKLFAWMLMLLAWQQVILVHHVRAEDDELPPPINRPGLDVYNLPYIQSWKSARASKSQSGPAWTNLNVVKAQYVENGANWVENSQQGRIRKILPHPVNGDIIYVLTCGGLYKTADFVSATFPSWSILTDDLITSSMGSVDFGPNPDTLYLATGDPVNDRNPWLATSATFVKSINGGRKWTDPVPLGDAQRVYDIKYVSGTNERQTVILVATNAGVFRSTDGGSSFEVVLAGTAFSLVQSSEGWLAAFVDDTTGISQVVLSQDEGATWPIFTDYPSLNPYTNKPNDRTTLAVGLPGDHIVYALADSTDVYKSTDGGMTWTANGFDTKRPTAAFDLSDPGNTKPIGDGDVLGGQPRYTQMIAVDPSDADRNTVYIGNLNGLRSFDGGETWSVFGSWKPSPIQGRLSPYVHADYHAAAFTLVGFPIVGTDGGLAINLDGTNWDISINAGIAALLIYKVTGSPEISPGTLLFGAQDHGNYVRRGGPGSQWAHITSGDGFGVAMSQAQTTVNPRMLYSYANELVYSNKLVIPTQSYRFDPTTQLTRNVFGLTAVSPKCTSSDGGNFYTPLVAPSSAADASGQVFLTATTRHIYKTTDGGNTWFLFAAAGFYGLPDVQCSIFAQLPDSVTFGPTVNYVAIAGAAGQGLFYTRNGGNSWVQVNLGAVLAGWDNNYETAFIAWPADKIMYVAAQSRVPDAVHVAFSDNGGVTWQRRDKGLPKIPVWCLLGDPADRSGLTMWAGTALGVYRTTDGGKLWRSFGNGLPNVAVTSLFLNYKASPPVLFASTFGRSLWQATLPK